MKSKQPTPLRLLVVGLRWPPETFLIQLFRGLAERGVAVTLASPEESRVYRQSIPDIDIIHIPGWDINPSRRLWRAGQRFGGAMRRSYDQTRFIYHAARSPGPDSRFMEQFHRWLPYVGRDWDVVYFPWNSMAVEYLPLLDMYPSVISCRGSQINIAPLNPLRATLREGLSVTFRKAAAVHCVSEAIRHEAEKYGLDKSKTVVIRPAVNPDLFQPAAGPTRTKNGTFRVASTGGINWVKGYEYALSAVRRLVDRGLPMQYDIIGSGHEDQRLLYTIQDLDLGDYVVWHGKLAQTEIRVRLQEADVFLLSSLSEGISNAVLEGMACGLPVVTSRVGGMSEAVTDGVEGFLVPSLDTGAMADALEELWRTPELRRRMGMAGRARVSRDFRLDDQMDAFADLFWSVAER